MKQMAIMKNVTFGMNDRDQVGLTFTTYLSESQAAGQFIPGELALEVIKKYGVSNVNQLNGKPCWVETDELTFIKFIEPCVI